MFNFLPAPTSLLLPAAAPAGGMSAFCVKATGKEGEMK